MYVTYVFDLGHISFNSIILQNSWTLQTITQLALQKRWDLNKANASRSEREKFCCLEKEAGLVQPYIGYEHCSALSPRAFTVRDLQTEQRVSNSLYGYEAFTHPAGACSVRHSESSLLSSYLPIFSATQGRLGYLPNCWSVNNQHSLGKFPCQWHGS